MILLCLILESVDLALGLVVLPPGFGVGGEKVVAVDLDAHRIGAVTPQIVRVGSDRGVEQVLHFSGFPRSGAAGQGGADSPEVGGGAGQSERDKLGPVTRVGLGGVRFPLSSGRLVQTGSTTPAGAAEGVPGRTEGEGATVG